LGLPISALVCANVPLTNGSAVCDIPFSINRTIPLAGNFEILTEYRGDANFTGNDTYKSVRAEVPTTTTVTSSVNPSLVGQPVTFTATVAHAVDGFGSPPGYVQFFKGDQGYGEPITGIIGLGGGQSQFTTSTLSLGSYRIRAQYYPTIDNTTSVFVSSSGTLTHTVALAPTAATVSISGQVTTATGRGIRNVSITLTDSNGNQREAQTTSFGYYRFDDVAAGETVTITAKARRFRFNQSSIVRTTNDSVADADFISEQ
jgi:hypothetical protein